MEINFGFHLWFNHHHHHRHLGGNHSNQVLNNMPEEINTPDFNFFNTLAMNIYRTLKVILSMQPTNGDKSRLFKCKEAEAGVLPCRGWSRRLLLAVTREGWLLVVARVGGLVAAAVASRAVGLTGMIITTSTTLVRGRRTVSSWEKREDRTCNYIQLNHSITMCDWKTVCFWTGTESSSTWLGLTITAISSLVVGARATVRALVVAPVALLAVTLARGLTIALVSTTTSTTTSTIGSIAARG